MTPSEKKEIDDMTQYSMCRLWRYAESGHPLLAGETGQYFSKVMKEKGGMTPEISKQLSF